MAELASAFVCHRAPGRVRLRIPARKWDKAYFSRVKERLDRAPGVEHVAVNPTTGSVLIHHGIGLHDLALQGRQAELFELAELVSEKRPLAEAMGERVDALDVWLKRASDDELDLFSLAIVTFAGLAVAQLLRGNIHAPAVTLGWYTLNAMSLAQSAAVQRELSANITMRGS